MNLVEPNEGKGIDGLDIPREFYWILDTPTPLAGMRFPRTGFPWSRLWSAGFPQLVALEPGPYNPTPLTVVFSERLQDLVGGGPPANPGSERAKIRRAVKAVLSALDAGQGVVVHCVGGRGRTGTVLGCVLRELGHLSGRQAISYLDRLHKARGKPGWPESRWQSNLVEKWDSDG